MKAIVISGLALALLTGGALAQAVAPPPPPPGPGSFADEGPGGPPPPGGPHGRRPPPPPSKAAHFRLEHGDIAIDVKCADDEPMKACADLTLQMLDRLQALPKP